MILKLKSHIQLILVNDGSNDNSENLCLKYKNLYPDNIEYIYKKMTGFVSEKMTGCNM